ncbi:unnamed protein product [Lactuca saligna]|uniref:F-box domain-containing protein n=1 Tax=Lactuca saligna TaxID=75948 RepID=A0AA36A2V5_LACSI|nr:unnamed protein product [Lactuca saligna]
MCHVSYPTCRVYMTISCGIHVGLASGRQRPSFYLSEMAEMTVSKPKQHERNWLELPSDVMANILYRVGVVGILENARKVCTTWHKICEDPSMWRVIHMKKISGLSQQLQKMRKHGVGEIEGQFVYIKVGSFAYEQLIPKIWWHAMDQSQDQLVDIKGVGFAYDKLIQEMCKHAVDQSQGQLVDITIVDFACDRLLQYVADRSSQLKRLEFVSCKRSGHWNLTRALRKFPMLEELNLYKIKISEEDIETAGRCCPMLKTLKVNQETCCWWHGRPGEKSKMIRNRTAVAIGENLPELRHLELIGNNMTNIGLEAILNGCCHLELLDLRECFYLDLKGDLGKKCLEKIKCVKLPRDSIEGCLYYTKNDIDCKRCEEDNYFYNSVFGVDVSFSNFLFLSDKYIYSMSTAHNSINNSNNSLSFSLISELWYYWTLERFAGLGSQGQPLPTLSFFRSVDRSRLLFLSPVTSPVV